MDYRLEPRYFVIKISDLDYDQFRELEKLVEHEDIPCRDSVVIEADWPEYTPVVDMLFGRINRETSSN